MQERPIKAHGDLASEEVRHSDCRYRRLFETTQDGLLLLETASGLVSDVNPYLVDLLGYAHGEWVEELFWEAGPFAHSTDSKAMFADMQTADFVRYEDVTLRTKAGARIDVEFVSNSYDCEGIKVIQCNIRDISDRKAREAKFQRLTHLYAALSQANQAIVHCSDEGELFLQICHAAVKFGGMKMAWVGLVETDTLRVRPVANVGEDTEYLNDIHVSIDANSPFGRGPTGTAIRESKPQWCQDLLNNPLSSPWHEHIVRHGLAASASLPLSRNGMVIGALTLYAGETGAFDEAARRLLVEMATDISFALDVLAREVQRKNVEEEIASKNAILETQQETSLDAFLVVDENRRIISYN
ncbi:MAG: GAF domain-containing protein, partial [Rhodanobacter sp.]|nr:GAF domain-containing protein [Rhodanobacter sp.]